MSPHPPLGDTFPLNSTFVERSLDQKERDRLKATNKELMKALEGLLEIGCSLELHPHRYTTANWLLWLKRKYAARIAIAKADKNTA